MEDRIILEKFVKDDAELLKLENYASKFNVFKALNLVRAEVKHSTMLAWLLNPKETHGQNDYFLKLFLEKIIEFKDDKKEITLSILDIRLEDFCNTNVKTEHSTKGNAPTTANDDNNRIDVFIKNKERNLVCIIENKVDSSEGDNQLKKYYEYINNNHNSVNQIFIYLTPGEDEPSDERYIAVGYKTIAQIIEKFLQAKQSVLSPNIVSFIEDYMQIIEKEITMSDTIFKQCCKNILSKHSHAIKIIKSKKRNHDVLIEKICKHYEASINILTQNETIFQEEIMNILKEVISNEKVDDQKIYRLDFCSLGYIRFIPYEMDFNCFTGNSKWASKKTNMNMLFEIKNSLDYKISLDLVVASTNADFLEKIFGLNKLKTSSKSSFPAIFSVDLIPKNEYQVFKTKSPEDKKEILSRRIKEIRNQINEMVEKIIKLATDEGWDTTKINKR